MKRESIRSRMSGFFITVGFSAVLLCLLTIVFFLVYQDRYQEEIRQIADFHSYTEELTRFSQALNMYTSHELPEDYGEASECLEQMTDLIQTLFSKERRGKTCRELKEMGEMTETLHRELVNLHGEMETYLSSGKDDFSAPSARQKLLNQVIEAIQGRCEGVSSMLQAEAGEFYQEMHRRTRYLIGVLLAFLVLLVTLIVLQNRGVYRSITLPITQLTQKAYLVQEGKLSEGRGLAVTGQADLEIQTLREVFDEMTVRLEDQFETMKEIARVKQELQESRFKELQMQINPHFLFNTLNMIAQKAYFENADETVELLEQAAKMFRYSLDFSGKTVPLWKEMEELGVYVFIQEQRFGERIRFSFSLDERFHDMELPTLTVQPLVENAIIHGIGCQREGGVVTIRTFLDEECGEGCIRVEDNGCGFDEARKAELYELMKTYEGGSARIGLGNVAMRLRYFFGERGRIVIESEPGRGTAFTVRMPYPFSPGEKVSNLKENAANLRENSRNLRKNSTEGP